MNNKGFTLVELILVVAIIALLSLIFTPNVMSLINRNNTNSYNDTIDSVISATNLYVSNHRYELGISCDNNETSVTLEDLINTGDLSKLPENPCDNSSLDFDPSNTIRIIYDCETKRFNYEFRDKIEESECR